MEALRREDPRRFGRFTVLARFQEAASAVQYVARDTGTGELAVITAARPALAAVPAFRRRFQAEARTAERLAGGWVTPPLETGSPETGSLEAGEDELLWTATAYVPALPLADAVGIAGPLPERALRILGAGVAEILSRVHAGGSVLQGLAPGTVLLAEDGPRLTAFGPLGAAAAAEARPGGQLSVRLGYLTPEQVAGREVGAPSDLFVLGLLLAYAATGTTPFTEGPPEEAARRIAEADPELDAVPRTARADRGLPGEGPGRAAHRRRGRRRTGPGGRGGLARGGWLPERLAAAVADQEARVRALEAPEEAGAAGTADPAGEPEDAVPADAVPVPRPNRRRTHLPRRPRPTRGPPWPPPTRPPAPAPPTRPPARPPGPPPTRGTSARTGAPPASSTPAQGPGHRPLPATGPPATPTAAPPLPGHAALPPSATTAQGNNGNGPMVALPLPPAPTPPEGSATSRRTRDRHRRGGGRRARRGRGAVTALGGGETAAATDARPPAPKPRRTLPGQPPEPRWSYSHPASESAPLTTALWRDRLLVVTSESQASAVDVSTGKRVWQRADAAKGQAAVVAGDLCFVASPTEFLWLAPKDGTVVHRVRYADGFTDLPDLQVGRLAGHSGTVIWFTGSRTVTVKAPKPKKGKKKAADKRVVQAYFFAYDIVRRARSGVRRYRRAAPPARPSTGWSRNARPISSSGRTRSP
ncbi:serine/threonine protein kinase [Streptomyces sp. MT29]|nr:serine/threonine protein kinase [Streptomyces sp. MT29]